MVLTIWQQFLGFSNLEFIDIKNFNLMRFMNISLCNAFGSAWPPFEERLRLNFLLSGLCWIWGFANPESNLSSGPLATNQV